MWLRPDAIRLRADTTRPRRPQRPRGLKAKDPSNFTVSSTNNHTEEKADVVFAGAACAESADQLRAALQ